MYNHEITKLVKKNLELDRFVAALIKNVETTGDIASLERAEEIQEEIFQNLKTIEKMRGEN